MYRIIGPENARNEKPADAELKKLQETYRADIESSMNRTKE